MIHKYGGVLQCRMNSSRLPGKTLKHIHGKPMLERIMERLECSNLMEIIIIATTENPKDDPIEELALQKGFNVYRGSEENVLNRVLEAAQTFSVTNIVELHGDNPFLDPAIIDKCIKIFDSGEYDYLANDLVKTFPQGTRIQIFPTEKLSEVRKITNDPAVQEHVSLYFYENLEKYRNFNLEAEPDIRKPELRFTVDTIEDFNFISSIYEIVIKKGLKPDFSISEAIKIIDENSLKILNSNISSKPIR